MEPALDSDSETHLKKIGTVEQIRGKTQNGPPCKCTCYFLFGKLNYNILSDEVRNQMSGKLPQELNYLQIIIFLIQREFLKSSIFISKLKKLSELFGQSSSLLITRGTIKKLKQEPQRTHGAVNVCNCSQKSIALYPFQLILAVKLDSFETLYS